MIKKQFIKSNTSNNAPLSGRVFKPVFRGSKVTQAYDVAAIVFDRPVNIYQMKVTWTESDNEHGMYAQAFNASGNVILNEINESWGSPHTFSGIYNCVEFRFHTYGAVWASYFRSVTFELINVEYVE